MSGEKTRKLDTCKNFFKQWAVQLYVDKTIGQLTKVRTSRRLTKTWADVLRKLTTAKRALHL